MRLLSRLAVGTKLALVMTLILAVVSLWIYIYFPEKLQRQALAALAQRATAIADVTAFSVAPALHFNDRVAAAAALTALRRNHDLIFYIIRQADGGVFASFNEMVAASAGPFHQAASEPSARRPIVTGMTGGEESETKGAFSDDGRNYETSTPIRYHGRMIGTLVVGFTLDRVLAETGRSKAIVALATLLAFALGVVAVFALSTVITGPLRRIADTAERFTAGETDSRASVESGFEFAEEFMEQSAGITYMNDHHRGAVMRRLELNGAVFNEEVQLRDRKNQGVWALENIRLVQPSGSGQPTLEGILLDINDRKKAEVEIAYRAYHDELTGLPNRPLFVDRLEVALANARRKKIRVGTMFLDLHDLKTANDTLGHPAGASFPKRM